jgi:hypothetical protein
MADPLAEVGIKLLGNWEAKVLPAGVILSEHKTVFLGVKPRKRADWEAALRHHGIGFEYTTLPKPAGTAEARP